MHIAETRASTRHTQYIHRVSTSNKRISESVHLFLLRVKISKVNGHVKYSIQLRTVRIRFEKLTKNEGQHNNVSILIFSKY